MAAAKKANSKTGKKSVGTKAPMPVSVSPMLCSLVKEPPDDPDYIYEIKWDGYRIIAYKNKKKIRLDSRGGLDYTRKYPVIEAALAKLGHDLVLDGEVVVFNEAGLPDFDALQLYNGHYTPISYCVFDILWMDGNDLRKISLRHRKQLLEELVAGNTVLRFSASFDNGPQLYEQMKERNLEGIVAKRAESFYKEGERAGDWLKVPTRKRQEFVIGGWAESERGRSFRSLLFGAYNNGKLEWIGRSGGGYKEKDMPAILEKLKKLETARSPFSNRVLDTKGAVIHYVKPQLVANFEFATWTKSGRIRKPATFLGFRKDKKAREVVREIANEVEEVIAEDRAYASARPAKKKRVAAPGSNWRILEKNTPKSQQEFDIGDCSITISDVERSVWKGIHKAALIEYYHSIAKFILPHLRDRPLSLHIKPNGATAPGLYIKDMEGREPDCAAIFSDRRRHPKPGKRNQIDYLVCNNEATLLYLVNLGCIDMNPWMSRTQAPAHPDFINIDLDPSDDDFSKVIDVALAAKQVLLKHKLTAFVKTSGKTGVHIYVPVQQITFGAA
jgi:bifunctional non-homologous end joining protein LigD